MKPLRISAISYLNTAPLMWDFESEDTAEALKTHFQFEYTVPSICAQQLKSGVADIGIIPVAAYAMIPDLVVIPNISIASKNAVRSILLVSKVPLWQISTVAIDSSSLTSAALVQVLLRKFVGANSRFTPHAPILGEMLREHDAGMLIGDPALQIQVGQHYVYDLAEQWRQYTGLPFVFAFWAIRKEALHRAQEFQASEVFQHSRNRGANHLGEIANSWAVRLGLQPNAIRDYLSNNIDYSLDEENMDGLRLFFEYANQCKVLPRVPEVRFHRILPSRGCLTFGSRRVRILEANCAGVRAEPLPGRDGAAN